MNWPNDDLDEMLEAAWSAMAEGAQNQTHPFHLSAFATQREGGASVRTMVLRFARRSERLLACSTDLRAAKTSELKRTPWAEWLFYDARSSVQIRACGPTLVRSNDPLARSEWTSTPLPIRAHYANPTPSGTPLPASKLKRLGYRAREASMLLNSEAGYANFGVILTEVTNLDWLQITRTGAIHASFAWDGSQFAKSWIV